MRRSRLNSHSNEKNNIHQNGSASSNDDIDIGSQLSPTILPRKSSSDSVISRESGITSRLKQLKIIHTIPKEDVPVLFREPFVESGFRPLHKSWFYYIVSIFQLHNESMNVWTHLVASGLMLVKLVRFHMEIDFLHDPHSWPMLAGLICGILLYAFSSIAHCLQSKSELVHYTAFMVDYAGIGIYGLGSVIVHLHYCSEDNFYEAVKDFFVPLGSVFAFLICYCCAMAKVIYRRPYPFVRKIWQMAPVAGIYVVLISPIAHRLWTCFVYGEDCNDSIPYHIHQMIWFGTSGFFFASEFPQRYKPGSCDYFFHSHQLFHIAIMICTLIQMDGVFVDFKTRPDIATGRPTPTFASAFGPVILVLLSEALFITIFHFRIKKALGTRELDYSSRNE